MFVCGFYNIGIMAAKGLSIKTYKSIKSNKLDTSDKNTKHPYHNYYIVGLLILLSGICYMIYSLRLFSGGTSIEYTLEVGIGIATFTFTELGMSIYGLVIAKKNKNIMVEAFKLVNLATSLLSLVLTQVALLSFNYVDGDPSHYNGISGIVFSSLVVLIGIYMIFYTKKTIRTAQVKEFI